MKTWTLIIFSLASILSASAQQCGSQAGGALCPNCLCCSQYGYCGTTDEYCGPGCQSQCDQICAPPPPPSPPPPYTPPPPPTPCGELTSLISRELFEQMLLHRNDAACPARGFYTYDDFIAAAKSFEGFAQGDDSEICKREIAAFLGQTSHETTGGWPTAPDGPYAWGYCFKEEIDQSNDYCVPSVEWPCVAGKKYYGRGPIQISYNYNYGPAGQYLGLDLLSDPDLVALDGNGMLSFETAFWFWMTPQAPKPSCHDVITGKWTPSPADVAAGRLPGYGLCTNIINGGLECGRPGPDDRVENRIGFYKRYCDLLGVSYGDNLDCYDMSPYGFGLGLVHENKMLDQVMGVALCTCAWGYCFKEEVDQSNDYCVYSSEWPCASGKKYYGRGPIQISYNYNYGPAGQYLGVDLLNNPDLVASDGLLSFKTAFWFWMTPQAPKPSCHDVITGKWTPSPADVAAGRLPGYGLCTNIINGGLECGLPGPDDRVENWIGTAISWVSATVTTLTAIT